MTTESQALARRLIVGLDVPNVAEAERVVGDLAGLGTTFKIGYRLVFSGGLELARDLARDGHRIFLDMKLLDIDNTVAEGVERVAAMGVAMLTVHAYPKAMRAAVQAARGSDLCLLGVTVLTSMDAEDLREAGYATDPAGLVEKRARQARAAGMGGIVCAATEAAAVRTIVGENMAVVTPGIRLGSAPSGDDQKRVMGPGEALRAGASDIVVARPIVGAGDRRAAAEAVLADMRRVEIREEQHA